MSRKPVLFGLGIGGIAIVLLIGALSLGAATYYTSTSTFCNSCHEMSTQYVSWTRSTHEKVECIDCHAGVGIQGYVEAKIGGLRQAVKHYFGKVGKITAHVDDPVCLHCHYFSKDSGYQYEVAYQNNPLFVPDKFHRAHFMDKEANCTTCHARLVHGSVVTGGTPIRKQVCVDCHTRKKIYAEIVLPAPQGTSDQR